LSHIYSNCGMHCIVVYHHIFVIWKRFNWNKRHYNFYSSALSSIFSCFVRLKFTRGIGYLYPLVFIAYLHVYNVRNLECLRIAKNCSFVENWISLYFDAAYLIILQLQEWFASLFMKLSLYLSWVRIFTRIAAKCRPNSS
jgi:hypothetical protein